LQDFEKRLSGLAGNQFLNEYVSTVFTKFLLPAQRRLIVFAYILLINLST